MIGAGIFVLSGNVAKIAGPAGVVSFAISGLLAMITAYSYATFAKEMGGTGGGYTYISATLNSELSFIGGIWLFFAYVSAGVLYAASFGYFFGLIFNLPWYYAAFVVAVLLTGINALSFRGSVTFERLVVGLKLVLLGIFIGVGITGINPSNYRDFMPSGFGGVLYSAALIFIAFEGFDVIATMGNDVNDRSKLPIAIYLSIAIVLTIYVLVILVMTGILHYSLLPSGEAGFISVATMKLGFFGFAFVVASAIASALGAFNATIFAASRVAYSMARDGNLPKMLGKMNSLGTPHVAVSVSGLLALLIMIASAIHEGGITLIGSVSSLAFLMSFAFVNLALLIRYAGKRQARMILPLLGLISCLALSIFVDPYAWALLLIYTGTLYFTRRLGMLF